MSWMHYQCMSRKYKRLQWCGGGGTNGEDVDELHVPQDDVATKKRKRNTAVNVFGSFENVSVGMRALLVSQHRLLVFCMVICILLI